MTTLEKIRAEILGTFLWECETEENLNYSVRKCLEIIDKYAEQEPCEDCDYSEIMDWEQDAKTGKAKPIYWCEKHKEPCDNAISREATLEPYKGLNDEDTISVWLIRKNIEQQPSVNPQPICEEREKGECPYYAG